MRLCAGSPTCSELVERGRYCPTHHKAIRAHQQRYSTSTSGIHYGRKWKRAKNAFLALHPWCNDGCGRLAEEVDHIIPHKSDPVLFWDQTNWQALSKQCHSRKTAKEVGLSR